MRPPIRRLLVVLVIVSAAFFQLQCTPKTETATEARKVNPAAEAAYASGFRKQQSGNFDGAIADYTKAIEADSQFSAAYNNRGDARRDKGDSEGAIADYTKAIEVDAKNGIACVNRGILRDKAGDSQGALADFSTAIERTPKNARAYTGRADIRNNQGDFAGAIADYTKAVQFESDDAGAYRGRAQARHETGDLKGAIADGTKAIELEPKLSTSYVTRGVAFASAEQWQEAADDFGQASQAAPTNLFPALYRWVAQTRAGKKAGADLGAALQQSREGREGAEEWPAKIARFLLGSMEEPALLVAADTSDVDKARSQQCQAWYFAGCVHLAAGQKEEAVSCFQKSVATDKKSLIEYRMAKEDLARLEGKK